MRLLSWNLNGRRDTPQQLARVEVRAADIVALQEVTLSSIVRLRKELPGVGLPHVLDSFNTAQAWEAVGPRRYAVLLTSRFPVAHRMTAVAVPWPERFLSGDVETPRGSITFTQRTFHPVQATVG